MTEKEQELVKLHMLDVKEFQQWIADTRSRDMKKNPNWQLSVSKVVKHLRNFMNVRAIANVRQEVEQIMSDYVEAIVPNPVAGDVPTTVSGEYVTVSGTNPFFDN